MNALQIKIQIGYLMKHYFIFLLCIAREGKREHFFLHFPLSSFGDLNGVINCGVFFQIKNEKCKNLFTDGASNIKIRQITKNYIKKPTKCSLSDFL